MSPLVTRASHSPLTGPFRPWRHLLIWGIWEIWDGQRWSALGKGRPLLPYASLADPYVTYRDVGEPPVLSGRPSNTTIVIAERHTGNFTLLQIRPDDSGRYQTELVISREGCTLLMQFTPPQSTPVSLWAPFAFLEPGREMVPLTLQPVSNITSEPRLVLHGKAPIQGGRVTRIIRHW